jgi:hypothetical protein
MIRLDYFILKGEIYMANTLRCTLISLTDGFIEDHEAGKEYDIVFDSLWYLKEHSYSLLSVSKMHIDEIETIERLCSDIIVKSITVCQGMNITDYDRCEYSPALLTSLTINYIKVLKLKFKCDVYINTSETWGRNRINIDMVNNTKPTENTTSDIFIGDNVRIKNDVTPVGSYRPYPWTFSRVFKVKNVVGDYVIVEADGRELSFKNTDVDLVVDGDGMIFPPKTQLVMEPLTDKVSIPLYLTPYNTTPTVVKLDKLFINRYIHHTHRYQISDTENGEPIGFISTTDIINLGLYRKEV